MSKKEFLDKLTEALVEKMDISEAMSHIKYYKDYIDAEIAKGKSEGEVIDSLQAPRLIAKNITMNTGSANKYSGNINDNTSENYFTGEKGQDQNNQKDRGITFSINGKPINNVLFKIILFSIIILLIVLVFAVVGIITWFVFKFVVPVAIIVMIVSLIKNIFTKK